MQHEQTITGRIEAACFESTQMSIMIEDIIYYLSDQLMDTIFPELTFTDRITVSANVRGSTIIEITDVTVEEDDQ